MTLMTKVAHLALVAGAAFLLAQSADAGSLNFNVFSTGSQGTTTLILPEATLTTPDGTDFYISAAGIDHEVCAISGGNCQADINIAFVTPVSNLFFETFGFNPGDTVEAKAFDSADTFLGSVVVSSNTVVDMSAFSGIARLFLDDSSTGAGFGYDHFTFDAGIAVPEPATLALLGLGLAGLGVARRRKVA